MEYRVIVVQRNDLQTFLSPTVTPLIVYISRANVNILTINHAYTLTYQLTLQPNPFVTG